MDYRRFDDKLYVRLDKDDEIIGALTDVCAKENLTVAQIQGIGGCDSVTVGVFDCEKKMYNEKTVEGLLEMTSLDGNLTYYEGKPYLHLHMSCGDGEGRVFGGHLNRAVISATAEIVIRRIPGEVGRRHDETIGLNLFDF